MKHSLALLAPSVAVEPGVGIGGRALRLVRSFLAMEVRFRIYAASQRIRKRIKEAFGWIKTTAREDELGGVAIASDGPSPSLPPKIIGGTR